VQLESQTNGLNSWGSLTATSKKQTLRKNCKLEKGFWHRRGERGCHCTAKYLRKTSHQAGRLRKGGFLGNGGRERFTLNPGSFSKWQRKVANSSGELHERPKEDVKGVPARGEKPPKRDSIHHWDKERKKFIGSKERGTLGGKVLGGTEGREISKTWSGAGRKEEEKIEKGLVGSPW